MLRKFFALTIIFLSIFTLFAAETQDLDHWWEGKPIREFVYIDLHEVTSQTIDVYTQPYLNKAFSETSITKLKNDLLNLGLFIEVEIIPSRYEGSTDQLTLFIEFIEQQKLVDIIFKGNKVFTSEQLKEAIALKIDTMFDTKVLSQDVQTIKKLYQNRGYDRLDVVPSYESDLKTDGIIVTYTLTEYEWYLNKPIKGFDYENLKNVAKDLIDDLTYSYIGKPFTQQLYRELEGKLNELGKFSLFQAEAKRGGAANNDLYLLFKFTELPVIKSIAFENNAGVRTKVLEDNLDVKKGDFLSIQKVNSTKEDLIKLYKGRGYASVAIDVTYEIDEKTNLLELKYRVTEGQQSKISEINFEGNANLSSSLLRKEISSKVQSLFNSGNYEEAKVHADSQALQLAYQKRGFIDAEIDDLRMEEIESDKPEIKKLKLTFVINEGALWYYGGIKVEGNSIYSDDDIYQLLTMKEGSVLNIEKVQQEIGKIADLYWNEGYVENTIDIDERRNEQEKNISYRVIIGERGQASVEEIIIRGLTKTKPYVLERELALKVGDIFSKDKYVRSAQNLYNTGLLTDVIPSISYGTKENSLVVTYEVTEGNQMNIGFGATFGGNVEGFPVSGFLSWSDTNVGGTGRDLEIMTELSPTSQTASISFKDSWVGDKRWSNAINLSFNRSTYANGRQLGDHSPTSELKNNKAYPYPYTSYEQWVNDGSINIDSQYLMNYDLYRISLGYSTGYTFMFKPGRLSLSIGPTFTLNRAIFDSDVYTPFDYSINEYGKQWQFSNRIGVSATWDGRDLIQNPTKGYVVSQSLIYSGGVLGGLSNFMRSSSSASAFLKIFDIPGEKPTPGVVSLNTTVSFMFDQWFMKESGNWIWGMSASKYEYLYIDGITLARGIAPRFYFEFLWDSSLEFSIQLAENVLWAEAFVSATGATENLSSVGVTPLNWYFAAGFGIRLKIPGFPLGLYLVKNATIEDGRPFAFEGGPIFGSNKADSGLKLVLAITTSIY